jgi:type III secretion protein N (ATPase)
VAGYRVNARATGCVLRATGETLLVALPGARVGDGVRIRPRGGALGGEVIAVARGRATVAPFGALAGIGVGDVVEAAGPMVRGLGCAALGRALDAAGEPLDGGPPLPPGGASSEPRATPAPHERGAVRDCFSTGVRALDGLLTVGRGARLGFFGAPGAGKTTLLETIVRAARADAVVLALVGERGREAQRWFERLNHRTTAICATSDRSAAERVRAADVALAQAQLLRERGLHVLLLLDSLARYASALRELRTSLGEPVGRGGYPAAVWAHTARYLEGAGNAARGSITLLATVLSDGDDERDPLGDAARSLLDGHIVLSSELARAGRFPAIDVLASASRTMRDVVTDEHLRDAATVRGALALLAETRDARALGFAERADPALAAAVAAEPALAAFLQHAERSDFAQTRAALGALARTLRSNA